MARKGMPPLPGEPGGVVPVSVVVKANVLAALAMVPKELRGLIKQQDTETGTVLLEWEARKGYVAMEIGVLSYNMTYVPDDLDATQWGSSGSMVQLALLQGKLGTIMPAFDKVTIKVAHVQLFNDKGRFIMEESWRIPDDAEGPWSMKDSPDFHRMGGGAVLVEAQEPWGFPFLIP